MTSITQADRDAAHLLWKAEGVGVSMDDCWPKAFARHREAALTTAQAEAEALKQRIAELEGALLKIADDLGEQFLAWVEEGCEGKDAIQLVCNISQFARAALTEPMP